LITSAARTTSCTRPDAIDCKFAILVCISDIGLNSPAHLPLCQAAANTFALSGRADHAHHDGNEMVVAPTGAAPSVSSVADSLDSISRVGPSALTPAQQKEATRLRAQGATLQELARSYNVGISTIRRATATGT
jgi:hypothetical protein